MRIAISINTSWNIYNFRSGLIRRLIAEGHHVIAIAPKDEYADRLIELGCEYESIQMENTGGNPVKDLILMLRLRSLYKRTHPDIVLHYTIKPNIYGTLAAKTLGIPVINNVSGLGTVFLTNSVSSVIAKWLYRISFRHANLIFFQNKDDKNDFTREISLPESKVDLLPGSGIDLVKYSANKTGESESFVFLMIARLIEDKGVFEFARAASQIRRKYPHVECQLLGPIDEAHSRGISKVQIQEWSNDGHIKYLGTSDDVREEINHANCIVLPSYREGTPKTLLEAGAMSKPIIATDVPGCREVVEQGINGLLCRPQDPDDLLKKMIDMTEIGEPRRLKMGQSGRELVEKKYDEKFVIDRYMYHISQITGKNSV